MNEKLNTFSSANKTSVKIKYRHLGWSIIILSSILRLIIIIKGGQQFWPDESRYIESRIAIHKILSGYPYEAWQGLIGAPEHVFFKITGLIPAYMEKFIGENQYSPAIFFSIFSILNLWLIWKLAETTKADEFEALTALFLAAGANCLFYFSRHYLPYDLSLCLGLSACYYALVKGRFYGFLAGILAALCFLAYNGYFMLSAFVLLCSTVSSFQQEGRPSIARLSKIALGFLAPLVVLSVAGLYLDKDVAKKLGEFSNTITQGDLGRSITTIPQYFWSAENINSAILISAVIFSIYLWIKRLTNPGTGWAISAIVLLLMAFVAASDIFFKFTVYGRIARLIWPFVCLAAAASMTYAWRRGGHWRLIAAVLLITYGIQASLNFSTPIGQWFPKEFNLVADKIIAQEKHSGVKNLSVIHTSFYFSPQSITKEPLPLQVVWSKRHPQQWAPYLFEGFTRNDRLAFLSSPADMSVVRLGARNNIGWLGSDPQLSRFEGFPGQVKMTLRLPNDRLGTAEPLIVTGKSGSGDSIYIIYQDASHIRIGFDHWGVGGLVSSDILVDFNEPHILTVGMGSLFPATFPEAGRDKLYVELNGRIIWNVSQKFHQSDSGSITFGVNLIGGGTSSALFSGKIVNISPDTPKDTEVSSLSQINMKSSIRND
jgi:hypothetical protein